MPTDSAVANRELITRFYAAANRGDLAAIESLKSDSCVLVQPDEHPAAPGLHKGHEEIGAATKRTLQMLRPTAVLVDEVIADGPQRVIALVRAQGADRNDEPYEMPIAECFRIENGRITEIRPYYWDLAKLRKLVGAA